MVVPHMRRCPHLIEIMAAASKGMLWGAILWKLEARKTPRCLQVPMEGLSGTTQSPRDMP